MQKYRLPGCGRRLPRLRQAAATRPRWRVASHGLGWRLSRISARRFGAPPPRQPRETVMQIAIIGIGNVGAAWGQRWDPHYGHEALSMFLCGDDPDAKKVVTGLVAELGFEPVDAGPLTPRPLPRARRCSGSAWLMDLGRAQISGSACCDGKRQQPRSHDSVPATNVTNPAIAADKPPRAATSSAHTIVCTRLRRSAVGAGQRRSKLPLSDGERAGSGRGDGTGRVEPGTS